MKIVMIGPVYPFKGGIAHYTSLMSRSLMKRHKVTVLSYKLQYPRILFKREQRDYENTSFKIDPTHYIINTVNPCSWFAAARFIRRQEPDIVIAQWWHPFFAPAYWSLLGLVKKHCKVIFLCHNVFPHEKFPAQRLLTRRVLGRGDGYIVQSGLDEEDLLAIKPEARYRKTVHPTYNAFNITGIGKYEAREKLDLSPDDRVLLFFGFVREYKGLKHLLNAMPEIAKALPGCKLLVVGDVEESEKEDYARRVEETGCKENIRLVSGYVPDKEVENYFSACDLVVLPYESATQSGIVQISYGFNKPVVATDVGGLPEVIPDDKTGYIVPPLDHYALADAVIRFFEENRAAEFEKNIELEAYRYSWDRMTEIVESLYEECKERADII